LLCVARFEWRLDDPEIVSDVLFAVANVLSIARTTYLMPAFEVLGPLQVSLGRMLGDITRFLVLFTLVSLSIYFYTQIPANFYIIIAYALTIIYLGCLTVAAVADFGRPRLIREDVASSPQAWWSVY